LEGHFVFILYIQGCCCEQVFLSELEYCSEIYTWSLTLREECRLRVFENRVLRRIFGPKREEVTGERGRLHKEELCALYSSPSIIRVIKSRRLRWTEHVALWGRVEVYTEF
jgi:hypothetical protein